ncbi:bifunctional RNase H/acid phosphatase [Allobranchiibius sp. CTAmp26]|uniref:bifunctional RNase H/acid phosphatase n=1 Tax=Allobranchiibius sp. CTAmp26 TaxID=2815214 RepID=UPI0027DE0CC8|nr:bifunctional RNase H/acid phosphatase [Allobranchiibius sp. CTAmp26]
MRELIVEADGGSRGNPGVAGYGALVRDAASGELLAERAAPLGKASNNVAEYSGLIAGLEAAEAIDPGARVAVRMDSKLVVEQMAGRWKIKHEDMKRLALEANSFVRRRRALGGDVTWTWIPREINKDADKLSNDGMDGRHVVRDLWSSEHTHAQAAAPEGSEPASAPAGGADATDHTGTLFDTEPVAAQPPSRPAASRGPDPATATTVVLLRHGVTDFTVGHKLDGRGGADPSLNARGRQQAAAAADELADRLTGPVQVVSSSLARARETGDAAARALGMSLRVDADWDEQSVGTWDGLTFTEIEAEYPAQLAKMRSHEDFRPGGGESHTELVARVAAGFRRAVDTAGPGGTVIVATHRKPLMVVLALILGISAETAWMLQADPASLTTLQVWADGRAVVQNLNVTHHLP